MLCLITLRFRPASKLCRLLNARSNADELLRWIELRARVAPSKAGVEPATSTRRSRVALYLLITLRIRPAPTADDLDIWSTRAS
jgi:hypothetical protein